MKYEKELDQIQEFIDNFDTAEFSSSDDSTYNPDNQEERRARALKIKARLGRKRQMEESFRASLQEHIQEDQEVMITQDEIDALLESV